MEIMIGIIVFIYGVTLGSFFNVIADRWLRDESINGRSRCENCGMILKPKNLVPIFSFLIQKGKCSNCGIKLSKNYVIAEILTGFSFLLVYMVYGISIDTLIGLIFMSYLIISAITDAKEGYVLDRVVIIPTVIVVILTLVFKYQYDALYWNIIPSIVIFILMVIAVKLEKLGSGDVLIISSVFVVHGMLLGAVVMLITSFSTLIFMLVSKKKRVPFIPFWLIGNILTYIVAYAEILNRFIIL